MDASAIIERYGRRYTIKRRIQADGVNAWSEGYATHSYEPVMARSRPKTKMRFKEPIQENDEVIVIAPGDVVPADNDYIAKGEFTKETDKAATWGQVIEALAPDVGEDVGLYRCLVRF